mgnify:CR=1 FL=1
MLKRTKNEGLKALIECTGINPEYLNTYDLGFVLGPYINASGETGHRKKSIGTAEYTDEAGCGHVGGRFKRR